jgi:hypothetical protein
MHYLTTATMRNFNDAKGVPFFFTSHSDEWVPDIMSFSTQIKYDNCGTNKWKFTYPPTGAAMSVSARLANWIDLDGSASQRGKPTIMGATGDSTWWRTKADECDLSPDGYMWMCDLKAGVSYASMVVVPDTWSYGSIGRNLCVNDVVVPKPSGRHCPIIGYAQPISSSDPKQKVAIALNSKINGPVDTRLGGGWTVSFTSGAPIKLNIQDIQLADLQSKMILAIQYPSSATDDFIVKGNLKWCLGYCAKQFTKPYDKLLSLDALQNYKAGNGYFFDVSSRMLYIQVAPFDSPSDDSRVPWLVSNPHARQYVKGGRTLLPFSNMYIISVTAKCWSAPGSLYCAKDV